LFIFFYHPIFLIFALFGLVLLMRATFKSSPSITETVAFFAICG